MSNSVLRYISLLADKESDDRRHSFIKQELYKDDHQFISLINSISKKENSTYNVQSMLVNDLLYIKLKNNNIIEVMSNEFFVSLMKELKKSNTDKIFLPHLINYIKELFKDDKRYTDKEKIEYDQNKDKQPSSNDDFDGYSDVLYWEAVHEGEIDPTQSNNEDYDYPDSIDQYSGDHYVQEYHDRHYYLRKYLNIVLYSNSFSIEEKAKIFYMITGFWESKLDFMANLAFTMLLEQTVEDFAKKKKLLFIKNSEHFTLINSYDLPVIRIYWLSNIADQYRPKDIRIYEVNEAGYTNNIYVEFTLNILKLFQIPINNEVKEYITTVLTRKNDLPQNKLFNDVLLSKAESAQTVDHVSYPGVTLSFRRTGYNHLFYGGNGSFLAIYHINKHIEKQRGTKKHINNNRIMPKNNTLPHNLADYRESLSNQEDQVKPTNVRVLVEPLTNSIKLILNGNHSSGIKEFLVFRSGALLVKVKDNSFIDYQVNSGQVYHYSVQAMSNNGIISDRSPSVQASIKIITPTDNCFIATAAYGSLFHSEVVTLRKFRDKYMNNSNYGRLFIKCYYRISPPIARFIKKNDFLKKAVRILLAPIIKIIRLVHKI